MYTVKQVAALTGVAEATLRVWERRYEVVRPVRSSGGYRLYDDAQLAVLREMAALVEAGVPASRAAASVAELTAMPAAPEDAGAVSARPDGSEFVAAAASLEPAALADVLGRALASGPFEEVADDWILPQLVRLGQAWESGELSVAQEHFASAGLMRAVAAVFDAAPATAGGPAVLVGLPAGDRHQLALLCFATCLRRRGVEVVYLGSDIPTGEWVLAAERSRARAAVVGVTATTTLTVTQELIDALRRVSPPLSVWVGGSLRDAVDGAHPLPDRVAEAAALLHRSLAAGRL